jgi:hypothetical protein
MVVIRFQDGTEWFKANWVFRQLLRDITQAFPDDSDLVFSMRQAGALGGLFLDSIDGVLAGRILRSMKNAAESTIRGVVKSSVDSTPIDADSQRMYHEAMSELLDAVNRQSKS